jgi:cytochrome c-type biogenesis protein CcmH
MNGSIGFFLAAGALLLIVLFLLTRPLLRGQSMAADDKRKEINLAILRGEMRELERERAEGLLDEHDFAQAKNELQRRLLEEAGFEAPPVPAPLTVTGRRTATVLLVALPLAAAGGYALLGNPRALDPPPPQAHRDMGEQEIDALLQRLNQRLAANPDDMPGWILLARSYKRLGHFSESAKAFARAESAIGEDASLLADYAEVLALSRDGDFTGKPAALIARALEADPGEPRVLFVAGAAARARRDFAAVIDYWGRLLSRLDPGSDDARELGAAVDRAREMQSASR